MAVKASKITPLTRITGFLSIGTFIAYSMAATSLKSILAQHTIGQFIPSQFPPGYTDVSHAPKCADFFDNSQLSTFPLAPWSCTLSPLLVNQGRRQSSQLQGVMNTYAYFAEYDDGNGNGYKIIYPLQLCPSSIIGDVTSSDGNVVHDATLQSIWTSLAELSPDQLYTYTVTMLQDALDKNNAAIGPAICNSANGGMKRMPTYQPSDVSGRWVFSLFGIPGLFGLVYGVLYVPIAHPGVTANLTGAEDTAIIAANAVVGALYFYGLDKLHKKEVTNVVEAWIWTQVVTAAQYILHHFQRAWSGVCISAGALGRAIGLLHQHAQEVPQAIGAGDQPNQPGVAVVPPNNPAAQPPNPAQVQISNVCDQGGSGN